MNIDIFFVLLSLSLSVRILLHLSYMHVLLQHRMMSDLPHWRPRPQNGQSEINNRILLQIRQWSNLMEVETLGVHSHLNDQSRICSYVLCSKRSFMARLAGAHISTSQLRLGSSCLHRQSGRCCFVEESGSPQRLQAYLCSISLRSGLCHLRENRSRENIHNR